MLYKRFIPKVLVSWDSTVHRFNTVLTTEYRVSRKIGDPLSHLSVLQSNLVDEIMLINLSQSRMKEFTKLVDEIGRFLSTPLSVGGFISKEEDCSRLIAAGADRLILGRNRWQKELSTFINREFGRQAVACSLDYLEGDLNNLIDSADQIIRKVEDFGYGEILLNCTSRDGARIGPDLKLLETFAKASLLPIVVGCGIGSVQHITDAFLGGASGVASGTFLSNLDQSPKQIRAHLFSNGVHIRHRN